MSYYCILYLFAAEWVRLVSSSTNWSYRKVCQSGHVLKFTIFYHALHHEKRKGVRTSKGRSVLPCTLFSFAFYNMHDLSYLFLLSHCVKVLWIYKLGNLVLSYGHFWPLNFELGISSFCATTNSCLNLRITILEAPWRTVTDPTCRIIKKTSMNCKTHFKLMNFKFLKKLWCCVSGKDQNKNLVFVRANDEGLTLEMSAF